MALPNGDLITTVFDPQMAYPVDKRMQVDTLNSRDSMSMFIRWEGMEVYVLETSKKYILQGGRSNEYWKENGTGTGTGGTTFVGQFATADLLPTSGRSAGDYAFVGTGDDFVQYNWDNIANEWVMAEGQTDMASEFFHIGYKTPLRRPVIFPLFPKDVLVETSGDFVFAPETAVARFIFVGEVEAIRGIETAAADREIKLVNRTGSDIPLMDKASGIPSGSGMDFGGTDYTWVNGSEITLKGNGTYWELALNNQVAFSDHLDSVNVLTSMAPDGKLVKSNVLDPRTGEYMTFKEVDFWIDGTPMTSGKIDGFVYVESNGKYYADSDILSGAPLKIKRFGAKGDRETDDTAALKLAVNISHSLEVGLQGDGFYRITEPITLTQQPSVDLSLVVDEDFVGDHVVDISNPVRKFRDYTIRIDGQNVDGVAGISLGNPTTAQIYVKAYLQRLETGINVFRNAEKLQVDVFAYQCGVVVHEYSTTSTPDQNRFNISGSGNVTLYKSSGSQAFSSVNFNAEGNYSSSERAIIIENTGGKGVTLSGHIRGFICAAYIDSLAQVHFNGLMLNDGGRPNPYTEAEANNILPSVKIVNARTVSGEIIIRPSFGNSLEIDKLGYGGLLNVIISDWRANGVTLGNGEGEGSVQQLDINIHLSSNNNTSYDNYQLKVFENVFNSIIHVKGISTGPIIFNGNSSNILKLPARAISTNVPLHLNNFVPTIIEGGLTTSQLLSYPYKITGMKAFNSDFRHEMIWDGTKWHPESYFHSENYITKIYNPPGGILDLSNINSVTGALVIRFPKELSGAYGLYNIELKIHDDGTPSNNKTSNVILSGRPSGTTWTRQKSIFQDMYGRNLPVKYGFDGAYPAIFIGEEDTQWAYPAFEITNVVRTRLSASSTNDYLRDPWELSIASDLSGFSIVSTHTNNYPWGDYEKLINKPNITNASTTQRGIIEQATDAETITGTDTERAVSPANLQAKLNSLILSATATLDFPVIAAGETERLTTTVTGAALLDPVLVSGPDNIYNSNDSTIDAWVSAENTVTVRVRNNGASSIDPGEGQFKIKVFK